MKKGSLQLFAIGLLGLNIGLVYVRGQLATYIHPSTIWMVVTAATFLLILFVALLFQGKSGHSHTTPFQVAVIFFIALALTLKSVPLSASLAKQRFSNNLPVASRSTLKVHGLSQNFNVLEWLAAWDSDTAHQKYVNAKVDVTGFIAKNNGVYSVDRLLITCCVVDAQPIELPFAWLGEAPAEGAWVEMKGTMRAKNSKPLIQVESITKIAIPDQPYVY